MSEKAGPLTVYLRQFRRNCFLRVRGITFVKIVFFAKESWVYSFLTLSEIVLVFWKKIFCRAVKTAIYVSIWRFRLKHRFFGNLITFLTFFWYLGKTSLGPLTKTFRQEIKTAFYASKELFLRDFFDLLAIFIGLAVKIHFTCKAFFRKNFFWKLFHCMNLFKNLAKSFWTVDELCFDGFVKKAIHLSRGMFRANTTFWEVFLWLFVSWAEDFQTAVKPFAAGFWKLPSSKPKECFYWCFFRQKNYFGSVFVTRAKFLEVLASF